MTKPHILILQHDDFIADEWHAQLSPHARITWADSHNALPLLKAHQETITIVVVDSYITPYEEATYGLLEKIYDFNPDLHLFIAASNDEETHKSYYQWGSMTSRHHLPQFLDVYLPHVANANIQPATLIAAASDGSDRGYKPKVLCVEDLSEYQDMWAKQLAGKVEITQALTLSKANEIIDAQLSSFDIIVMDACVPGETPTTPPLIRKIRKMGFTGPIIAASGDRFFREELMAAGCSHNSGGKDKVGSVVLPLLPGIAAAKSEQERPAKSAQKPSAKSGKRKLGKLSHGS